jgi:NADH dehydrogenase FAD-containing subunit
MARKVVIIGGGLGGLRAARALKSAPVDITIVDKRNHRLFQPLLYLVATGSLSPGEITGKSTTDFPFDRELAATRPDGAPPATPSAPVPGRPAA